MKKLLGFMLNIHLPTYISIQSPLLSSASFTGYLFFSCQTSLQLLKHNKCLNFLSKRYLSSNNLLTAAAQDQLVSVHEVEERDLPVLVVELAGGGALDPQTGPLLKFSTFFYSWKDLSFFCAILANCFKK